MDLETIAETMKCFTRNGSAGGLFVITLGGLLFAVIVYSVLTASIDILTESYSFLTVATVATSAVAAFIFGKWLRELYLRRARK